MASGDYPDIPFVQARNYTRGRPDGPPLWIVWHTMEEDELGDRAEAVARYFATTSVQVSAHYCIDNNSAVQCVHLGDSAWTVGNRPGNYRGINYELAGRASQTVQQWADAYSQSMLRRAAAIARRDMGRYNIPARWCTIDDLRAWRPGLTTHNDLRLAFGGTTHWDPGPNFPRAQVLALIEEDDVSAQDVWSYDPNDRTKPGAIRNPEWRSDHKTNPTVMPRYAVESIWDHVHSTLSRVKAMASSLAEIRGMVARMDGANPDEVRVVVQTELAGTLGVLTSTLAETLGPSLVAALQDAAPNLAAEVVEAAAARAAEDVAARIRLSVEPAEG